MKFKFNSTQIIIYFIYFMSIIIFSLHYKSEKNNWIVMDKNGNYYKLIHNNFYMGPGMYKLKQIDTTKYKINDFNKN